MGKFIAKKKIKLNFKTLALVSIGVLSLIVTFNVLLISYVEKIVGSSLGGSLFTNGLSANKISVDILNPKDFLSMGLNVIFKNDYLSEVNRVKNHSNSNDPEVYIYNTHESEAYAGSLIESYNIKYTVKIASYLLSDYLKDLEVPSYVEEASIDEFSETLGVPDATLYDASRTFVTKRINDFANLKLLIDIHRDSVPKETSTASIDGKSYAKVLFVVGMSHDKSVLNKKNAEKLNSLLDPALTRGIIEKTTEDGNGIYNQDLSGNAVLIEIGGNENTMEEVDNTLKLLATAIFKYLRES
ncbi:MAG TPA: hypothetical protein DCY94_01980 [Firmicutes bacterium]|nr:hypothetical protein [Bacillota bacterium]